MVVVTDGRPTQGNPPLPVSYASNPAGALAGPPLPVVVVGNDSLYSAKVRSLYPSDLIGYWALADLSGTTADDESAQNNNGTYALAGVTLGAVGMGDGRTAALFSGADTHVKIGSAAFGADWNGDKGRAIAWAKADNAARWTDGLVGWWFHIRSTADANYNVVMGKVSNNTLQWRRRSGGAITSVSKAVGSPTDWLFMGMTWDLAVPEIRAYDLTGLVGAANSGFTTWPQGTNVPDSPNITLLFAGSLTLQEWFGSGAQVACWANRVLSAAEIASLAQL
jgi:hypothetical protein